MFNDSSILITGGTGSFGRSFVRMTLQRYNPRKLIVFSRDEMKQWEMAQDYADDPRIRFLTGDVRDSARLYRAMQGVDFVVHAAATKIVPKAEYDPFECIKTNISGAMNVIDCAIDAGVRRVVALSTDKACSPVNLYGASKLVSDKSFISGNCYAGERGTKFAVVRYGNVMGSRGSVIPYFLSLSSSQKALPITHPDMTRFMITLSEGVELVWTAFADMVGGEIYVKKIPSMGIMDIVKAISPSSDFEIVGMRPGEKLHEMMISSEDARYTYEYDHYYKILSPLNSWNIDQSRIKSGTLVPSDFEYNSHTNTAWMTSEDLSRWISVSRQVIGTF